MAKTWDIRPLRSVSQKTIEKRLLGPEWKIQAVYDAMKEHLIKHPNDAQMNDLSLKLADILNLYDGVMQSIIDNREKTKG